MTVAGILPSYERLHECLTYDQQTGEFTWRINKRGRGARAGQPAGTWLDDYRSIMIDRKRYRSARVAWKMVTGEEPGPVVDHEDGNSRNDAFSNLRDADMSKNAHNMRRHDRNTSGYKGISFHKPSGMYQAQFMTRGKYTHLGYFETAEDAVEPLRIARERKHKEFACHGDRSL